MPYLSVMQARDKIRYYTIAQRSWLLSTCFTNRNG